MLMYKIVSLLCWCLHSVIATELELPDAFSKSRHTNNWAVLVDTSRFWFNYRHVANVLSIYRSVKRLGIPDSQVRGKSYLTKLDEFVVQAFFVHSEKN